MVKNKIIPAGSIAHIIQRAPGKEELFLEESDYLYFLRILKEMSKKHQMVVFAFCLMPNHFHLLVRFLKDNASSAIKNLCEKYADFFNIKYSRKGHVFYGRYRASICLDEAYFLTSSLYIHLNPLVANISQSFLFRWSTSNLYITDFNKETFVDYKSILCLLSENLKEARKKYYKLLEISLEKKIGSILDNSYGLRILRIKMLSEFFRKLNIAKIKNDYLLEDFKIEEKINALKIKRRLKHPQEMRARFHIIEQFLSRGYAVKEIGMRLGITTGGVYKIIRKFTKKDRLL